MKKLFFRKTRHHKVATIPFKCPYVECSCIKYDSGSATLLTPCTECEVYKKYVKK